MNIRAFFWGMMIGCCTLNTIPLNAAIYGSDTDVAIVNPFAITGNGNAIQTFANVKNGFQFADSSTTCSYYSSFRVAGPVTLNGGTLWLFTDLVFTNTGSLADLGIIRAQNHTINLAPYQSTITNRTNPTGVRVFNLQARVTQARTVRSVAWTPDNAYVAVVTDNYAGASTNRELFVYSFSGTTLTLATSVNLGANGNCVRWHPSATSPYYLAVASATTTNQLKIYSFTPPGTLTQTATATTGAAYAVAWQGRGKYLAVGCATAPTLRAYPFSGGTLGTAITAAGLSGTVNREAIVFAPVGNQDDLLCGTSTGNLYCYRVPSSGTTLSSNFTYSFAYGSLNGLDWANTSTFVAAAFTTNRVKTYQLTYSGATPSLAEQSTYATSVAANSVSWKPTATVSPTSLELAVGTAVNASGNEFFSLSFDTGTSALASAYSVDVPAGINAVRYSRDTSGTYIARIDNTTFNVNIFKESYSPFIFNNANIILNNNITLSSPLTLYGTCTLNGRGNTITFTGDGAFNIAQNSSIETQVINLRFEKPGAFALQGPTSKVIFRNADILLNSDLLLGDGVMETYEDVTFSGPHTFYYSSSNTATIHTHSILSFENLAEFKLGRKKFGGNNPLEFEDSNSRLNLDNASLVITGSGLDLKKGIINIYGDSYFDIDLTETAIDQLQGLTLGNGTNGNDVTIKLHGNGSTLNVASDDTGQGALVLNPYNNDMVKFYGEGKLSLNSTSSVHIQRQLQLTDAWLDVVPTSQIYFGPRAVVLGDNLRITNTEIDKDLLMTGTYGSRSSIFLDNGGSIVLNKGYSNESITVNRHNNEITGKGYLEGQITLQDANSTLSVDVLTTFGSYDITLNGGKVIFTDDANFAHAYTIVGNGTVQLNGHSLGFGNQESTWTSTLYFDGDQSLMEFNADVNLTGKWTFSRDCVIDGNGHELDLHNTGTVIIERGSTLTLRNMAIENLSRLNDIKGSDVNSTLVLDNCIIQLSSGYLWTAGKLEFVDDVNFLSSGSFDTQHTFSYISVATSTVAKDAHINLYDNVNFAIDKKTAATSTQPLEFEDNTGSIDLWGGTLTINENGLSLLKGSLRNWRASTVNIKGTDYTHGFIMGDSTSANDAQLNVGLSGGATLTVKNGPIFYNNYSASERIVFANERSTIKFLNGAGITARTNLNLLNGALQFPGTSTLAKDGGEITQTNITHLHDSPYGVHKLTTNLILPDTLTDGGSFITSEGLLVSSMAIASGTASVGGAAKLTADITLNGGSSNVNMYLMPSLNGDITLNNGSINLTDNLKFEGSHNLVGAGKINLNNLKLTLGTTDLAITSSLLIDSTSGQLELNSSLDFFGTWTFGSGICTINGRSNILDLAHGGYITIRPNTTLILDNINIKGLGHKRNNFIFMDKTSQLKLHRVSIGLDKSITTTQGGIYVDGACTFNLKNYNWTFDSAGSLTVDNVTLWKDQLGAAHGGNILFGSGTQLNFLTLLSTGTIKTFTNQDLVYTSTNALGSRTTTLEGSNGITTHTTHVNYATDTTISQAELFKQGFTVSAGKTLNIDVTLPVAGNLNLSGSGTLDLDGDLILDSGAYLTSGGIIKGDNNTLILTSSFVIPPSSRLKITGNLVIDGQGNNFVVGQGAQLIIDPSISVTLRNLNWFNSNTEPHLEMRADNANLTLDTVNICFDRNFNFTQGRMFIFNDVTVTGSTKVSFSSTKPLYIEPFSTLYFDLGTTFSYSPYPDGPHASAERTLLRLIDRTSQLYFDTCTIALPDAGMQLTRGTVCFDNKVIVNGNTSALTSANSFELGDGITTDTDVEIKVLSGAHVEMNGLMWHHVYTS